MANTLLNSSIITNTALAILHQKLNFVGSINRDYDDQFARDGAKIGNTLRIRLPNQYQVRTGPTLVPQDTTEQQVTLTISKQLGVDILFSSTELTLNIDNFAERYLKPAMTQLAAAVEADALNMSLDVYNQVNGHGSPQTFRNVLLGQKALQDALTPMGDLRCRLNTQDNVDMVDGLKGLFQSSQQIKRQYEEGVMGIGAGFEFAINTHLTPFARGAENGSYTVNGGGQTGSSLVVAAGSGAGNQGDVFTIAGVFKVHPETKVNLGILQQFVLTAPYTGGAGTMAISPAIVASGPYQNVSNAPANSSALVFAGTASTASGMSLAYHKDAFTFVSADLVLPNGVDMAARKVQEGISMRMVRQYDVNNDRFPCRFDILYGYRTIRPQLAVRLAAN